MRRPMDEALFGHPEVIVHFREIFVSSVRNKTHDALRFFRFAAIPQRAGDERPRRRAAENSFFPQKFARNIKTFFVVDFVSVGHERHVEDFWNKIFADTLHGPAAGLFELARLYVLTKNRAFRIGQDHFDSATRFHSIEKPSESRQGCGWSHA